MVKIDELPLALLSILWRLASFTTIPSYHNHDASWRSATFSSTVTAHGGTWTTWVLTAIWFVSTVNARPASTWIALAPPILIGVCVLVVFITYTSRGSDHKKMDLFLGAPLLRNLPSASNLLVIIGIAADLLLLALRSGWLR